MRKHAILSPSAAERWLHCTASALIEAKEEDRTTDYADEGTLAHAYCAKALKELVGEDASSEDEEIEKLAKWHSAEMDEAVEYYVDIVTQKLANSKNGRLLVERRVEIAGIADNVELYGTSDAIILSDDALEVIDFKYGKGVKVSAVENPQMMIYALGARLEYGTDYNFDTARMTIVQPRIDNFSEYEMSDHDLCAWLFNVLAPKARTAMSGGYMSCGDWCRFCRVRGKCSTLAAEAKEAAERDIRLMSLEEVGHAMQRVAMIEGWCKALKDYALDQAMGGAEIPGGKSVAGRSVRKILNEDKAAAAMMLEGYAKGDIYRPDSLKTITDLEKLCGKSNFAKIVGEWIVKPQGSPTLAPADDARKALDVANDLRDF